MLNRILKGVLTAVFLVVTAIGTMVLVVHQENKSEEEESNDDFDPDSKMITRNKLKTDEEKEDSFQRVGEFKEAQHEKKMKEKEKSRKLDKIAKEKAEKERQKELEKQRKLEEEKKRKQEEEKRILAEAKKREEEAQKRVNEEKKKREITQQQKQEEEVEKIVKEKSKDTGEKVMEEKEEKPQLASRGGSRGKDLGTFNVSWYGTDCAGCHPDALTASGISVKGTTQYQGYGVAAADWSVLPPYSIVEVEGYGQYIVLDRGGAIKNKKLDLLTTSEAKSSEYGRQHLNVKLIRRGKGQ